MRAKIIAIITIILLVTVTLFNTELIPLRREISDIEVVMVAGLDKTDTGYEMSYCPMPVGRRFVMVKTDEGYEELIFYPGSNLIFDSDPELIIYEKTDTEETHIDGFGLVKIVFENKKGREEEYFHVFKKSLSKDKALKEYYKVLNKYKSKYNVIKSYVNWYNEESGQVEYL